MSEDEIDKAVAAAGQQVQMQSFSFTLSNAARSFPVVIALPPGLVPNMAECYAIVTKIEELRVMLEERAKNATVIATPRGPVLVGMKN